MSPHFQTHKLNEEGFKKAQQIAHAFDALLTQLELIARPFNREMSIVRTKLEEACFFAKKAMASDERNQVDENRGTTANCAMEAPPALDGRLGGPR